MKVSHCSLSVLVLAFLGISLLIWPTFVILSAVIGHFLSDGELMASLNSQPKRLLIADFFKAYQYSMPYTATMALISSAGLLVFRHNLRRSILVFLIIGVIAAAVLLAVLPFSALTVLLVLSVFLLFLLFYAVCAFLLQRCDHA